MGSVGSNYTHQVYACFWCFNGCARVGETADGVCVCGLFCTVSGLRGQTASEYGPFLRRLGRQRSSQNGQHSLHRCGLQWEGKRADHAHLGSYRTFQWLCCVGHTDSLSLPVRVLRRVHCLDWYTLR